MIKWLGYPSSSNSWEPSENLDPSLLESIEEAAADRKKRKKNIEPEPTDDSESTNSELAISELDENDSYVFKFEKGFIAEKIWGKYSESSIASLPKNCTSLPGAQLENDELMFLFKYRNSDEGEFVPARIANVKFAQLVIEFYERITLWTD